MYIFQMYRPSWGTGLWFFFLIKCFLDFQLRRTVFFKHDQKQTIFSSGQNKKYMCFLLSGRVNNIFYTSVPQDFLCESKLINQPTFNACQSRSAITDLKMYTRLSLVQVHQSTEHPLISIEVTSMFMKLLFGQNGNHRRSNEMKVAEL